MHVLITRQIEQSKKFSSLLDCEGIKNSIFPLIRIKNIRIKKTDIDNIKESNCIIFTSQNSVTSLLEGLEENLDFNAKTIAAIGESTKYLLNKYNINVDIVPSSDFSSESLLVEIKKQNIANPKYIIIKGLGGRTHLHDKLSIDNFVYDDVNTYSRNFPENLDKLTLNTMPDFTHICITSVEVLNNFLETQRILKFKISIDIVFISGNERIGYKIREFFPKNKILISENPTNQAMLKTILS